MAYNRLNNFSITSFTLLDNLAKKHAGSDYSKDMKIVLKACYSNQYLSKSINSKDVDDYIKKWVKAYLKDFNNRISLRRSNSSKTIHDNMIDVVLTSISSNISTNDLSRIMYAHKLSMGAENIIGVLLEEYLSIKLKSLGWYCCWGQTIKAVDFCNLNGELLQIKNSDNSENSSSRKIRLNTNIRYWYRRESKTGLTNWSELENLLGSLPTGFIINQLDFEKYVDTVIKNNPKCLWVDTNNPWM